jgi:hypothetical protein
MSYASDTAANWAMEGRQLVDELAEIAGRGKLTLIYSAKDREHKKTRQWCLKASWTRCFRVAAAFTFER